MDPDVQDRQDDDRPDLPIPGAEGEPLTPGPAPRAARDPWAWASALAVVPLLLRSLGAPLGEPVAEDFDFLRRALLEPANSLLDGGGSMAFWRPVAHQLYYEVLGPLMTTHPRWVAAIHVVLLAVGSLLLYRAIRPAWPGPAVAAAASFPLLAESTRTLVAWPSHFVDLGVFLFSALALHEAAHRRMWSAIPALIAALLCKEVAVVTAALLPFMPRPAGAGPHQRARWTAAAGLALAAWALAYVAVRRHAGLELPHGLESDPRLLATPLPQRLWWAVANSARALFGLSLEPGPADPWAAVLAIALGGTTLAVLFADPRARDRLRHARGWATWGAAWFLASSATLASVFPLWMPNRSHFGSVGAGVAAVALTHAAHPALAAALVAGRLGLLAVAPRPPARIEATPTDRGAFLDFPKLARLQRLMEECRRSLRARYPTLPHGAQVGQAFMPWAAQYAFGGSHALQVWYRDTTIRWVTFGEFLADTTSRPVTIVEFQPRATRQIAFVEPLALRAVAGITFPMPPERLAHALATVAWAESVQRDTGAEVFLGLLSGKRSMVLGGMERHAEAVREAERSLRFWPANNEARFVLAFVLARRGRFEQASAQLDTLLLYTPDDPAARRLYGQIGEARARQGAAPPPK
jgi:hypothetical protein